MYKKVLNALDATGDSDVFEVDDFRSRQYILVQVTHSNTASTKLQGRIAPDMAWVDVHTFEASGAIQASVFPQMRFSATISSGTVTAAVYG